LRLFLDANIFLRAILGDTPEKARDCLGLLELIDERKHEACTSMLVLNEILWVLEGLDVPAEEIAARILAIARSRVDILPSANHDSVEEAIELYGKEGIDFQDALNAITARNAGVGEIISYDKHFDHIGFIKRREPDDVLG